MPKVLVADDSIAVRKVAERLLTEAGLGVTLAANGEEALAYLAKECPDVIVSDVIMPDKSGYEVCSFVRAQGALKNTPVLLISGIVNEEVARQAESCRADGVLKKPFQGSSLKDRVLELLAKKKEQAAPPAKEAMPAGPGVSAASPGSVIEGQNEKYQQALAKLKQVEEDLQKERQHSAKLAQRIGQIEGQLSRINELESMLETERKRSEQAEKTTSDLFSMTQRVQELDEHLKQERGQLEEVKKQMADLLVRAERVQELEMSLQRERAQSAAQIQRINEMQRAVARVKELEASLESERSAATQLVQQMTTMEKAVVRSQELAQEVLREQQRADMLAQRLSESEAEKSKLKEVQQLLESERERTSLLGKRVSEAEQEAQQATRRLEEIAKKLGEVALFASQLGSGSKQL